MPKPAFDPCDIEMTWTADPLVELSDGNLVELKAGTGQVLLTDPSRELLEAMWKVASAALRYLDVRQGNWQEHVCGEAYADLVEAAPALNDAVAQMCQHRAAEAKARREEQEWRAKS